MKSILSLLLVVYALSLSAQDAKQLTDRAKRMADAGDHEGAIELYSQAIEQDDSYLDAYVKRAFSYTILKEYEKSIDDYSKIIAIKPKMVAAYISRGSAYNKLKEYDRALKDFDKAIRIDPENQEAYNNRGWAKKGLGDDDGACKDWKTSKKMGNAEAKIIMKNNNC